ncbi:MAG: DUF6266 family protein [Chitinophagaceae bacterium]
MGKLKKGIFGGFSGKTGNVVGSSWKDVDVIRSMPGKRKNPPTDPQEKQQNRFGLLASVMQGINPLLSFAFQSYEPNKSPYNSAIAYNLLNAVTGTTTDQQVYYPTLLVSRGHLPATTAGQAVPMAAGEIAFSWTDNTGLGIAKSSDHAIMIFYEPVTNTCVFDRITARRGDGNGILQATHFRGKTVHTWIAFYTEAPKELSSNSIYTGAVTVL